MGIHCKSYTFSAEDASLPNCICIDKTFTIEDAMEIVHEKIGGCVTCRYMNVKILSEEKNLKIPINDTISLSMDYDKKQGHVRVQIVSASSSMADMHDDIENLFKTFEKSEGSSSTAVEWCTCKECQTYLQRHVSVDMKEVFDQVRAHENMRGKRMSFEFVASVMLSCGAVEKMRGAGVSPMAFHLVDVINDLYLGMQDMSMAKDKAAYQKDKGLCERQISRNMVELKNLEIRSYEAVREILMTNRGEVFVTAQNAPKRATEKLFPKVVVDSIEQTRNSAISLTAPVYKNIERLLPRQSEEFRILNDKALDLVKYFPERNECKEYAKVVQEIIKDFANGSIKNDPFRACLRRQVQLQLLDGMIRHQKMWIHTVQRELCGDEEDAKRLLGYIFLENLLCDNAPSESGVSIDMIEFVSKDEKDGGVSAEEFFDARETLSDDEEEEEEDEEETPTASALPDYFYSEVYKRLVPVNLLYCRKSGNLLDDAVNTADGDICSAKVYPNGTKNQVFRDICSEFRQWMGKTHAVSNAQTTVRRQ